MSKEQRLNVKADEEVDVIPGTYIECGDGSADCLEGFIFVIIITAEPSVMNPDGSLTFEDGMIEKHLQSGTTVSEEFTSLLYAETPNGTIHNENAISTLSWH